MRNILIVLLVISTQSLFAQDLLWAKALNNTQLIGGPFDSEPRSIAWDAAGNVYVSGYFEGTLDFDPNAGIQNITSTVGSDFFFAKYDASGNYIYAKSIEGTGTSDVGYSLAVDGSGNVYITGNFDGLSDFDPGPGIQNLTSAGGSDMFFTKYDALGNYVYAKSIGSIDNDQGNSIAIDASGNVYITGAFMGIVDFDPGAGTQNLTSAGGTDIFYARYDASGNYIYAKNIGGVTHDIGYSIAVDASGNAYITGHFSFTADFDAGVGIQNLTATGITDIFLAKYDASGNYVYAKNMGGLGSV